MKLPNPYKVLPKQKPSIPSKSFNIRFFNDHQYNLVATIADLIIPSDEDPGAIEAGVIEYIDKLVFSSKKKQVTYTRSLKWLDEFSKQEYGSGNGFLGLDIKNQVKLLKLIYETATMRKRYVTNSLERLDRKVDKIWDDIFGVGEVGSRFIREIREDVFYGFYSNPLIWKIVGYFGPPQPNGYPDYSEPPSLSNYTGTKRPVDNKTCLNCHFNQTKKKNHRTLIDRTLIECMKCHSIHDAFTKSE